MATGNNGYDEIDFYFTAHFTEWMKLMKPLFENDLKYKNDESKRLKKVKKSSLSTSFKSLELD